MMQSNPSLTLGFAVSAFFEVYGCQMNVSDADVVWSVLYKSGYQRTTDINDADVIMLITCAIRDNAESKIWSRLGTLNKLKKSKPLNSQPKICLLGNELIPLMSVVEMNDLFNSLKF